MKNILILGGTGFIGRNLAKHLDHQGGYKITIGARNPQQNFPSIKVDLNDPKSLTGKFSGFDFIFYLVHGLDHTTSFDQIEEIQVNNFLNALPSEEEPRLIYLGGLVKEDLNLSPHLNSRLKVGSLLRESGRAVIELRASIIIGNGSTSYEMIKALAHRLPALVKTDWSEKKSLPIHLSEVLTHLEKAVTSPMQFPAEIWEIGGPDEYTYSQLLQIYAKTRGLRRPLLTLPFLPRPLAREVLRLLVPEHFTVGEKLLESLDCDSVFSAYAENKRMMKTEMTLGQAIKLEVKTELAIKMTDPASFFTILRTDPVFTEYLKKGTLSTRVKIPSIFSQILFSALPVEKMGSLLPEKIIKKFLSGLDLPLIPKLSFKIVSEANHQYVYLFLEAKNLFDENIFSQLNYLSNYLEQKFEAKDWLRSFAPTRKARSNKKK